MRKGYVKALAALAIVVALVLGVIGYYVVALSAKYSGLEDLSSKVLSKVNDVRSSISELSREINSLSTSLSNVTLRVSAVEKLRKELSSIAAEVQSLRDEVGRLRGESARVKELRESINALASRVDELSRAVSEAARASDVEELRSYVEGLKESLEELKELTLFPVTVVDASGRVVTVPSKPTRVVTLLPSVTETVFAVGAGSQVVGVDDMSNYPAEVGELVSRGEVTVIGSGWYPDVERILSLKPDLVIGVGSVPSHSTIKEMFSRYGIPVVLLPDRDIEDIYTSINIVGRVTGHLREAADLSVKVREEVAAIRTLTANLSRPRVALIVWLKPLWVTGNGTWMNDLLTLAGGVNAYGGVSGWTSVDPESLLEARPDIIIVAAGHIEVVPNASEAVKYLREALGDAASSIPAVSNGRVYCIYGDYNDALVRPSPRVGLALRLLTALIHPEALGLTPEQLPSDVSSNAFKVPKAP